MPLTDILACMDGLQSTARGLDVGGTAPGMPLQARPGPPACRTAAHLQG
jgi:hypothetical protein